MTTQAKIGHGTTFELGTGGSPVTYTPIAEVVSVTPPSLSRDTVDATHALSPEKWREFIPGLRDGGEVSLDVNFIPGGAGTDQILDTFNSDAVVKCRISFPDSPPTVWGFTAFCTSFEPEAPFDDKMAATVTFKLTGIPEFVAGP